MSDLAGKVAIVTGASSGIGKKTAELLTAQGARVVAFARSAGDVRGDVADPEAIERLFAETEARYGPCEILVNNAGMIDVAPLVETDLARWRRMFAVNVEGVYLACRRALPSMLERGAGAIVNVASISGVVGPEKFPGWVSYCAAKGAVISLTEALAVEIKDRGVRVNAVSPGSVDTPMWAEASGGAPAAMTAEEIAETILFLASDRSRPMNGQNLNVYSS
ncbi:MAG TPA: SDR family NAD(P)-dependent oxidoreductase [Thermoanaerobaculia bacterium]|nr:SDR family NAD(P)-dependent oxidoreductase [Thermoanaerobaculia bacterium]